MTFDEQQAAYGVEVILNGDHYCTINYDREQKLFVLFPDAIDDCVSYFDSLAETEQLIAEEIGFDDFEVLR